MSDRDLLPTIYDLHENVEQRLEAVTAELDNAHYTNGNFTDGRFDPVLEKVQHYTYILAGCLTEKQEPEMEAIEATSEAFYFAHSVGVAAFADLDIEATINTTEYFKQYYGTETSTATVRTRIISDVQDYLASRPQLAQLINDYALDIDASRCYYDVAAMAAGLTFIQIELGSEEQYIKKHIELFEMETC